MMQMQTSTGELVRRARSQRTTWDTYLRRKPAKEESVVSVPAAAPPNDGSCCCLGPAVAVAVAATVAVAVLSPSPRINDDRPPLPEPPSLATPFAAAAATAAAAAAAGVAAAVVAALCPTSAAIAGGNDNEPRAARCRPTPLTPPSPPLSAPESWPLLSLTTACSGASSSSSGGDTCVQTRGRMHT